MKNSEEHHNVLSSFRVRGLPEDLTKNKEENDVLAMEEWNTPSNTSVALSNN